MNSPFKAAIFRTAQAMRDPQRKPHSAVFSGDASRKRAKYDHILVSILYDKREHEKHLVAHNIFLFREHDYYLFATQFNREYIIFIFYIAKIP